jgi:hypothetical protein
MSNDATEQKQIRTRENVIIRILALCRLGRRSLIKRREVLPHRPV